MPTYRDCLKSLWKRAPLWRTAFLGALLITLAFILYPPQYQPKESSKAIEVATYISPPPVKIAEPVPPAVQTPAISSGPPPAAKTVAIAHPQTAAVKSPVATAPQTATVSLATASGATDAETESGLNSALMGRLYSKFFSVAGFDFPLPPGNWAMLATINAHAKDDPAAMENSYFLGKIEHKQLTHALRLIILKSGQKPILDVSSARPCNRPNPLWISRDTSSVDDYQSCLVITNVYTPPWQQWADRAIKLDQATRAAAGDMTAKAVTYPQDFVQVEFTGMKNNQMVIAQYLFSPDAEGIHSDTVPDYMSSNWYSANINRFPEKAAYIEKLKIWAKPVWPAFKAAFADPTGVQPPSHNPLTSANAQTVSKTVLAGQTIQIASMQSVNPDCTAKEPGVMKILQQPAHGKAIIADRDVYPTYPSNSPFSSCNKTKVQGVVVDYTADADFTGSDQMVIEPFFKNGINSNEIKVNITVK